MDAICVSGLSPAAPCPAARSATTSYNAATGRSTEQLPALVAQRGHHVAALECHPDLYNPGGAHAGFSSSETVAERSASGESGRASGVAGDAVAIAIQVVMIVTDDADGARVLRSVSAAARAVVVRCVRIKAGAAVVRIALRVVGTLLRLSVRRRTGCVRSRRGRSVRHRLRDDSACVDTAAASARADSGDDSPPVLPMIVARGAPVRNPDLPRPPGHARADGRTGRGGAGGELPDPDVLSVRRARPSRRAWARCRRTARTRRCSRPAPSSGGTRGCGSPRRRSSGRRSSRT